MPPNIKVYDSKSEVILVLETEKGSTWLLPEKRTNFKICS